VLVEVEVDVLVEVEVDVLVEVELDVVVVVHSSGAAMENSIFRLQSGREESVQPIKMLNSTKDTSLNHKRTARSCWLIGGWKYGSTLFLILKLYLLDISLQSCHVILRRGNG